MLCVFSKRFGIFLSLHIYPFSDLITIGRLLLFDASEYDYYYEMIILIFIIIFSHSDIILWCLKQDMWINVYSQSNKNTNENIYNEKTYWNTRSIQRTQTPPRLWPLILWCGFDLLSRSRKLMSLDLLIVLYLCT